VSRVKLWLMQIRLPFLVLTPVSVFLGISVVVYELPVSVLDLDRGPLHIALAFIGALLSHIAVNVFNEYFDYKSGVDFRTRRTPFSGGSGVLTEGLLNPRSVYALGIVCVLVIIGIGAYFFTRHGALIIPLGIVGLLNVYFYTTVFTRSPLLCAIAPGLGFGPLMVMGTYFALTGTYSLASGLASLVPFFLVSNLLLLNQFPDVEADASANRRHLPIAVGRRRSAEVYTALVAAAYVSLVVPALVGVLPYMSLLGLLTLPLGFAAVKGALRYYDQIDNLIPVLGRNVLLVLLCPLLMAIGIVVS